MITNVKASFELMGNIVLGFPYMCIDSLLAHLEFRRKLGDDYRLLSSKFVTKDIPSLPIRRTGDVYHCSVSMFPNETLQSMQTFYKRFAENCLGSANGRIDRGRGFFKDYVLRTPFTCTDRLDFYASLTTDADWLRELLVGLLGLGKDINIGFGWIKSFKVQEIEEDRGLIDPKDSVAMRPIPISMLKEYADVERLNYKAPYWDPDTVAKCAVPLSKVRI
ncbi:MAG: hypothetical protein KGI50_07055 [Patescibacteria group bacterium]|nr:hypothetical protein [Patescibacteria group bacterium]MDE2439240.1 hypothetical protein [Patescibacteria group bacterium]